MLHQIIQQVRAAWRYRWLGIAAAWSVCVFGWLAVSVQQDVYEATARVYIDWSSDLRSVLGRQIIESDVADELLFVRQAILGISQLEKVARETGLADEIESEVDMTIMLSDFRRRIEIVNETDRARARMRNSPSGTTYQITYQHASRAKATEVVGSILDNFLRISFGSNLTSSDDAEQFLQDQILEYERRLTASERRLADFNQKNYDRLPSMQGGYFQRLQAESQELDSAKQSLMLAESRLEQIERQVRGETPMVNQPGEIDPNGS